MSELSIEAKRYNEALSRARKLKEDPTSVFYSYSPSEVNTVVDHIFPELKESEDEQIRKRIIQSLHGDVLDMEETNKAISWLEKQGEQKPQGKSALEDINEEKVDNQFCVKSVNKIESKFKSGDWIVRELDNSVHQVKAVIENISNGKYGYDLTKGGYISSQDANFYHLWTIEDAKDGDVLHSTGLHNDCVFIFNGLDNWKFNEPNGDRAVATGHCCLFVSADKMEFGIQGPDCIETNTVKPATKEQRDLLFQKMKEAGYEWYADKKGLKKIDDDKVVIKKGKNPTAWSEEDEEILRTIISDGIRGAEFDMLQIDWLKSLKDRYAWRASWEQLDALKYVYRNFNPPLTDKLGWDSLKTLELLYQELKKLMEK